MHVPVKVVIILFKLAWEPTVPKTINLSVVKKSSKIKHIQSAFTRNRCLQRQEMGLNIQVDNKGQIYLQKADYCTLSLFPTQEMGGKSNPH